MLKRQKRLNFLLITALYLVRQLILYSVSLHTTNDNTAIQVRQHLIKCPQQT